MTHGSNTADGESRATRVAAWVAVGLGLLSLPGAYDDLAGRFWASPELRVFPPSVLRVDIDEAGVTSLAFNLLLLNEGTKDGVVTSMTASTAAMGLAIPNASASLSCESASLDREVTVPFVAPRGIPLSATCRVDISPQERAPVSVNGQRRYVVTFDSVDGSGAEIHFCFKVPTQLAAGGTPASMEFWYPDCQEDL